MVIGTISAPWMSIIGTIAIDVGSQGRRKPEDLDHPIVVVAFLTGNVARQVVGRVLILAQ